MSALHLPVIAKSSVCVVLTGLWIAPLAAQQFEVLNRTLVSSNRDSRTHFLYSYRVDIRNTGDAAADVQASVTSSSPNTVVVDGELAWGNIGPGGIASSADTFTMQQNRSVPFDPAVLRFTFRSTPAVNQPPVANAGANLTARVGIPVQLDGSDSFDPDGTIAAYEWRHVTSNPPGAMPAMSGSTTAVLTVTLPSAAVYTFELTVTDNRGTRSTPDQVQVRTGPAARAGADQQVTAGATVQLDGTASFDPEGRALSYDWTLACPAGSTPCQLSDRTAAQPTFVADRAGTYTATLTVRAGTDTSAPDSVIITALSPPNGGGGNLPCGQLLSGALQPAQVDLHRFQLESGRIIALTLASTTGWNFGRRAVATLFDPSNRPVATLDGSAQQQITLTVAGTYTVRVQASDLAGTGGYNIGLECRNNASEVNAVWSCGALTSASIEAAAQVDQYTFSGVAGRTITLTLASSSGWNFGRRAIATLFAPSGAAVRSLDGNTQQQITLTETGTYVVQVRASDFNGTGDYGVGLECRNPTASVDAEWNCGSHSTSVIGRAAQVDQYTFSGQPGRIVSLTLSSASGWNFGRRAVATVFSPSGGVVSTLDGSTQAQVTLSEAGTYTVQVRASDFAGTGSYGIGIECRSPVEPVDSAWGCGALSADEIDLPAEVDQYTFTGQAGAVVTLTSSSPSGWNFGRRAIATVFAPSGAAVATLDGNTQRQFTLPETGTYVVQVRASDFSGTGAYAVGLECRSPIAPVNAAWMCGSRSSGSIGQSAQVDQYTFSGVANRIVTLTSSSTSGWNFGRRAIATVFSPSGAVVATLDGNAQQQITLAETGTFLVQVRASDFTGTGAYGIGLECRNPAAVVNAVWTCGSLSAASIGEAAQVDQYTFAGQVNAVITLTSASTTGWNFGRRAIARFFGPSGAPVTTLDGNDQEQITLTAAGTYVLQVSASDYSGTGAYSVGLTCF